MARNPNHEMLPRTNHDEKSRQLFTLALKANLRDNFRTRTELLFQTEAKPAYMRDQGKAPVTRHEIADAMEAVPLYQLYSALQRNAQEQMWDSVVDTLERDGPRLSETYRRLTSPAHAGGTLELDPDFQLPRGMKKVDIHLQPGGYCRERSESDIAAGALYEYGGNLYAMGRGVGLQESKGEVLIRYIKTHYSDLNPAAVLDIGCSAGSSSVPYAFAFPDAEVHAIDIAPGILRYAHARAEALGAKVHYHQRDACHTGFPDGSFDIVVSHNAMHEFPHKTTDAMMQESFRLLRPGGVAVHLDVNVRFSELNPWYQFHRGWDQYYNNEPYWSIYATSEPEKLLVKAGFPAEAVVIDKFRQSDNTISWYLVAAQKPLQTAPVLHAKQTQPEFAV